MPAVRLTSRRRRSSHAIFTPAKPGIYGARPVTFAPNVTPITYVETDDDDLLCLSPPSSPQQQSTLFPPSSTPAPPPARKRCPPGKRRSQGYIPRPPNAFMLFRADFVRQKHVPGSIETNHGSLSKIIGNCWRQLPLDEKKIWEIKAKQEKANHKAQFPDYRFRPVHNKNKNKDKTSTTTATSTTTTHSSLSHTNQNGTTQDEEERCEHVAQLLLKGMKGEDLTRAIRNWDSERGRVYESSHNSRPHPPPPHVFSPTPMSSFHNPFGAGNFGYGMNSNSDLALPPSAYHRRSSSVPLPLHNGSSDYFMSSYVPYSASPVDLNAIALPSIPFISQTRSSSPVNNIFRQQRTMLGHRRASSAQPVFRRSSTILNNIFATNYANTDFSGFDWASMNLNTQVTQDTCPLPDVELKFDGFSFDGVSNCAIDGSSLVSHPLSSSSASSSASNRSSPWLETPSHTRSHSQHRSSLSIAPHDLPPLDVSSSDMSWHGGHVSLLSATSVCSSSSSAFPSPDLSSPSPNENEVANSNAKPDLGITPTTAMFDLNLAGAGAVDYSGMISMGVVDYTYGYNDVAYGDMGMEMVGYNMAVSGGNDMGMGVGVVEMDAMWNGHGGQPQQA